MQVGYKIRSLVVVYNMFGSPLIIKGNVYEIVYISKYGNNPEITTEFGVLNNFIQINEK